MGKLEVASMVQERQTRVGVPRQLTAGPSCSSGVESTMLGE